MSFKEFDMTEIENDRKKYAAEVKERWGNTAAYKENEEKTSKYGNKQWEILKGEGAAILDSFGENRTLAPDSQQAQALVEKWQNYITEHYYKCTKEILAGLGIMYVNDERFKNNIDKCGDGTAEFMSKAIGIFCKK